MFAIHKRQAGLRTHERMIHAGESPSRVGRSGFQIRRYSFTVAGAVPGSHRLPVSLAANHDRYRNAAKHLTTSPTMLTAAKAIGKLQTQAAPIERLIN
jgi:hypothetical protein